MYSIGIDVGSTYTKYCVMEDESIISLSMEKTPIRQREYFENKVSKLKSEYAEASIVSCGYGKKNVGIASINELTALSKGVYYATGKNGIVLDIGGQDIKIILQEEGVLKEFFFNDKCAAGSGLFLANVLNMLGIEFKELSLIKRYENISLSTTCAVFAQSEIVELIANNMDAEKIVQAVIKQILSKAKQLLSKVRRGDIWISGGLSQIEGMDLFAESVLGRKCEVIENGAYMSAIGCALSITSPKG